MKIAHIGKGSEMLQELPAPPTIMSVAAKKYYNKLGAMLIKAGLLKEIHLVTLEMFATNYEQWCWSVKAIALKNRKKMGTGFMQKYSSGATNITTELAVKRNAEDALAKNIKAFGLDPLSEKALKATTDPAQTDLFADFEKAMSKKLG